MSWFGIIAAFLAEVVKALLPAILDYANKPKRVYYVPKDKDIHTAITDSINKRLQQQDSKEP